MQWIPCDFVLFRANVFRNIGRPHSYSLVVVGKHAGVHLSRGASDQILLSKLNTFETHTNLESNSKKCTSHERGKSSPSSGFSSAANPLTCSMIPLRGRTAFK
jgi:hypothetical protein